jgi:enoyl-CoA hydratase
MNLLRTTQNNSILTIAIMRPSALNALNSEVMNELEKVIHEASKNAEVKALIITGDGDKAFVAGADIKELMVLTAAPALALAERGQKLFRSIENFPKPVIAAVNGFALGGGCELAMACHMRIATENAKFGQPEVNLGIIPGYGGTQRMTQLVGRGKALELLLTGDLISANEAKSIGLVNHVVGNKEELLALAEKMLLKILAKGPVAVTNVIRSVNAGFNFENQGYQTEATLFSECSTTSDFKEGTSAFLEKRPPVFQGK